MRQLKSEDEDEELEESDDPETTEEVEVDERKVELEEKIREVQNKREEEDGRLQAAQLIWDEERDVLEKEIKECAQEEEALRKKLYDLRHPPEPEPDPPGPLSLLFVEHNCFMMIGLVVVIANVTTIVMETMHPHYERDLLWLDQAFLCFYIVEFVLKAILWRGELLFGKPSRVAWNWLDLVIIASALLEIVGAFGNGHDHDGHRGQISVSNMLRLMRLARLVRIVKILLYADLSFVEQDGFHAFIMGVIGLSSLMMGLEDSFPDSFALKLIEHIILLIFLFEITARLQYYGRSFFTKEGEWPWNWLDLVIVLGGILDMWMLPAISFFRSLISHSGSSKQFHFGKFMMLLRMARLLRILRLARLIRQVKPLYKLLLGIAQAMGGMMWVLLLVVVILYAVALLAVKLLRDGLLPHDGPLDGVSEVFPTVLQTMFVLFEVMNGHEAIMHPVFDVWPCMKFVFMLFVIMSSWAFLSILTAVVSENMITATEDCKKKEEDEEAAKVEKERREKLKHFFTELDKDGNCNGKIERTELDIVLEDQDRCAQLCQIVGMQSKELRDVLKLLERSGFVAQEDFVNKIVEEGKQLHERSVMRLEKELYKMTQLVGSIGRDIQATRQDLHDLGRAVGTPFQRAQSPFTRASSLTPNSNSDGYSTTGRLTGVAGSSPATSTHRNARSDGLPPSMPNQQPASSRAYFDGYQFGASLG